MSRRVQRVSELLKRELGSILQKDFEFPGVLVSVNDVELAGDLKTGKVFLGMIGPEQEQKRALEQVLTQRGQIQQALSRRVVLKHTPKLQFKIDHAVERGVQMLKLLDEIDRDQSLREGRDSEDSGETEAGESDGASNDTNPRSTPEQGTDRT